MTQGYDSTTHAWWLLRLLGRRRHRLLAPALHTIGEDPGGGGKCEQDSLHSTSQEVMLSLNCGVLLNMNKQDVITLFTLL